jgi:hypothetical protein
MIAEFAKMLETNGEKSVLKAQASISAKLVEHVEKLEVFKAPGSYTSSVEREIRTFTSQLKAISKVLGQ